MQWTSAPNIGEAPLPQRARGFWKTRLTTAYEALELRLEDERAQLPPWIAVGLIAGIAAWFALPRYDQRGAFLLVAVGAAIAGLILPGRSGRALAWMAGTAGVGMTLIWWRADSVAAPRLDRPVVATVTGVIEQADHIAARDQVRLVLATAAAGLPPRVRVTLDAGKAPAGLVPGSAVEVRARLAPPPGMALPGTYDFARDAWFKRIGAVGKAIGPVTVVRRAPPKGLEWARQRLRAHIEQRLPDRTQGIAVALATGDQNAVEAADADAMRRSGLTHLLSVSGLHIAAVVAAAMLITLRLLALSSFLALRVNLVIVAAAAAAAAGIGYTLLTGAQVPTVRSCVAAVLVLAGLALGRDAMSMRLIAAGALLVVIFRPEAVAGASFQMSFAAVVAIVALHSTRWARARFGRREEVWGVRLVRSIGALVATGLVVELALIPIALFHFHRSGLFGVAANIVAIPMTTFVIMPLEALALLFDTVGLGAPWWWLVDRAIAALLGLAQRVGHASGAVAALPDVPAAAMLLIVTGGLWVALWQTRWRRWGAIPMAAGATIALLAPRPDLLVTGDGRHLALIENGRPYALRDRSGDYVRGLLAEAAGYDGPAALLGGAPFGRCSADSCVADITRGGRRFRLLAIRSRHFLDWRSMIAVCGGADIVVADRKLPSACAPRWLKLDRPALAATGGLAIAFGSPPHLRTVAAQIGDHPWRPSAPAVRSPVQRHSRVVRDVPQ